MAEATSGIGTEGQGWMGSRARERAHAHMAACACHRGHRSGARHHLHQVLWGTVDDREEERGAKVKLILRGNKRKSARGVGLNRCMLVEHNLSVHRDASVCENVQRGVHDCFRRSSRGACQLECASVA
eukprot:3343839-Pleurochrysis_carterae.AAC.2